MEDINLGGVQLQNVGAAGGDAAMGAFKAVKAGKKPEPVTPEPKSPTATTPEKVAAEQKEYVEAWPQETA